MATPGPTPNTGTTNWVPILIFGAIGILILFFFFKPAGSGTPGPGTGGVTDTGSDTGSILRGVGGILDALSKFGWLAQLGGRNNNGGGGDMDDDSGIWDESTFDSWLD